MFDKFSLIKFFDQWLILKVWYAVSSWCFVGEQRKYMVLEGEKIKVNFNLPEKELEKKRSKLYEESHKLVCLICIESLSLFLYYKINIEF